MCLAALSFDDGPHPAFTGSFVRTRYTILGVSRSTISIGERALHYPEVVARIRAEGHEIGNHYFRNGATLGHSHEEFLDNLEKTERAIGAVEKLELFRPPGGVAWPRQIQSGPGTRLHVCFGMRVSARSGASSGVVHPMAD